MPPATIQAQALDFLIDRAESLSDQLHETIKKNHDWTRADAIAAALYLAGIQIESGRDLTPSMEGRLTELRNAISRALKLHLQLMNDLGAKGFSPPMPEARNV